jgi:protein-tyrosine phosphatase
MITHEPSILFVCTGNICRSPFAEYLLRAELAHTGISVQSAGTEAVVDSPIESTTAELLRQRGLHAPSFAARQFARAMIEDADLVLTMTRTHRARVLEECPAALKRAFTMKEFALITSAIRPKSHEEGSFHSLVQRAYHARSAFTHAVNSETVDVADPFGRKSDAFISMSLEVERSVASIRDSISVFSHGIRLRHPFAEERS